MWAEPFFLHRKARFDWWTLHAFGYCRIEMTGYNNGYKGVNMSAIQPQGYLALPETKSGPGLVVLHAWWGLNGFFRELCQRFAREGFITFAPDLYHGRMASTVEEAERLMHELNDESANADIDASIQYLRDLTAAPIGVVGFSLGGALALSASNRRPQDIRAVVLFYATYPGSYAMSQAAYLGHFAANDGFEPAEGVQELEKSLRAEKHPVTFYIYPDTTHWFFEQDRPDAYNAPAAELAWQRTIAFLRPALTSSLNR
jgi:carboxymethylenebutenolidase